MIETYLLRERENKKRDYLGISQIGYCPLQNFFLMKGEEEKQISKNVLERFEIGKFLHEKVIRFFIDNYPKRYISADIDETLQVSLKTPRGRELKGHFDLFDKEEKKVIDFKFYDHYGFSSIKEPHWHYIRQLELYIEGLKQKNYKCEKGELIYISTKTFQEKSFIVEQDKFDVDFLLEVYDYIFDMNLKELEKHSPFASWECKYCQFTTRCPKFENKKNSLEKIDVININTSELAALLEQKKEIEEKIEEIKSRLPEDVDFADEFVNIKTVEFERKDLDKELLAKFLASYQKNLSDFEKKTKSKYVKITLA